MKPASVNKITEPTSNPTRLELVGLAENIHSTCKLTNKSIQGQMLFANCEATRKTRLTLDPLPSSVLAWNVFLYNVSQSKNMYAVLDRVHTQLRKQIRIPATIGLERFLIQRESRQYHVNCREQVRHSTKKNNASNSMTSTTKGGYAIVLSQGGGEGRSRAPCLSL